MNGKNTNSRIDWFKPGLMILITSAVYLAAARLSLLLAVGNSNASPVWPPSGIAFAVIFLWGYRMSPAIFTGAFIANILALQSAGFAPAYYIIPSFFTAAGNMLESIIGTYLIKRFSGTENPFDNIKGLFAFIIYGGLFCTLISAAVGVCSYCSAAGNWSSFRELWLTWWLGDAAGILIVSPIIIMIKKRVTGTVPGSGLSEAAVVFFILTASSVIVFRNSYQLAYVVIPPMLWIALRFGRVYSAWAVLLVSGIAIISAVRGAGSAGNDVSLLLIQTYIGIISIITLCLSVLSHERSESDRSLISIQKQLRENLEEIIRERSAELVRINERLIRKIEEQEHTERALSSSEIKYRDLVESVNSIILRWRPDGAITFFNTYARKFFRFSEPDVTGMNIIGTIVPEKESSGRDLKQLMDDIVSSPEKYLFSENENIRQDGERVWISWTNKPVYDESGSVAEILSVGNDITELKKAEEFLQNTLKELTVAKEHAEAADQLKSAFLATMSHELRTPLNSIIGFTGIILQGLAGPLSEEQKKQMSMVQNSATHLLSLINDVLDISKIEAGQFEVYAEPFDLRSVIEKTAAALKPAAVKKGIDLIINVSDDVGEIVSDKRRVDQVLLNLIQNAVKFTDRGNVTLSVDVIQDYAPSGADKKSEPVPAVQFRVSDTGIGIQPYDLSRLFQPFRQVDTGIARKNEGTGLGLAICRRLAGLMGGEVTAESEWGRGSIFTFTIPVEKRI